jgi:GntR family transcriptional repressor for pyruvate dehydrogenase complex
MSHDAPLLSRRQRAAAPAELLEELGAVVRRRGLHVGDPLPSLRDLARELGVSLSAARETLLRAQALGLVRILPRKGALVQAAGFGAADANGPGTPPALDGLGPSAETNVFHLLEARTGIEVYAVGLAAERRRLEDLLPVRQALDALVQSAARRDVAALVEHDVRFHAEIARLSGNSVLHGLVQLLMGRVRRHLLAMPWTPDKFKSSQRSHAALYAALVAGDAGRARQEMQEHGQLAYRSLLRDIQTPVEPNGAAGARDRSPRAAV